MPSVRSHLWPFLRSRSGAGLLIVVLLLVHLFVLGPSTCPLRPVDLRRPTAAEVAAPLLLHPAAAPAAPAPSR